MVFFKGFSIFIGYMLLSVTRSEDYDASKNEFWNFYAPGELLRGLDKIVLNEEWIDVTPATLPRAFIPSYPFQEKLEPRIDDDSSFENQQDHEKHDEEEEEIEKDLDHNDDYDKTYEDFVRQYFSQVGDDLSGSIEEHDDDEDTKDQTEAYSAPIRTTKSKKKKETRQTRCKTVQEGEHECKICKNPRNGMKSKTCSYSKETAPRRYSYEKEKRYNKKKDSDEPEDDENSSESKEAHQWNPTQNQQVAVHPQNSSTNTGGNGTSESTCIRKQTGNKTCFHCKEADGLQAIKCFANYSKPSSSKSKQNRDGSVNESQKRIYKRTVSYIYENSSNDSDLFDDDHHIKFHQKPKEKRKILLKIIKKKIKN